MNSKTILSVVVGAVAGLALAMGSMAVALDNTHMGNTTQYGGMMGQPVQQNTKTLNGHDSMHETTTPQKTYGGMHSQATKKPVQTHHANFNKAAVDAPCHSNGSTKG